MPPGSVTLGGAVEIYVLCCPDTGLPMYVGKAKSARHRFKGHLRDARRRSTPVYQWIRRVVDGGKIPEMRVVLTVEVSQWEAEEIRLISEYRALNPDLLNVAKGGNQPECPRAVRAANGKMVAARRDKTLWRAMHILALSIKQGYVSAATMEKMRARPDVFGHIMGGR